MDGDAGAREAEPEEDEQEVALDFRLLRYFIAVAEELHLARAAERLGIEQSPVSRAMRDLESQLGVQLFDRSTRLTRLTWAGQVFLGECRRVMATVEQAVKSAKAAAQGYQGNLRMKRIELEGSIDKLEDAQRLNEATIDYVCNFIDAPARMWRDADPLTKIEFQKMVTESGIVFDIKNENFGTGGVWFVLQIERQTKRP